MDKDQVKQILDETPSSTVTITIQDAGGNTHSFTGTVAQHDVDSYESSLILSTDQRNVKIDYRSIIEIIPAT
jgi:hypothetical protein